ncbi:MAG: hypothetical protein AAI902_00255 [Candidatus Hodgkinia cicadicola]
MMIIIKTDLEQRGKDKFSNNDDDDYYNEIKVKKIKVIKYNNNDNTKT